jgi:hypothetical protein
MTPLFGREAKRIQQGLGSFIELRAPDRQGHQIPDRGSSFPWMPFVSMYDQQGDVLA